MCLQDFRKWLPGVNCKGEISLMQNLLKRSAVHEQIVLTMIVKFAYVSCSSFSV